MNTNINWNISSTQVFIFVFDFDSYDTFLQALRTNIFQHWLKLQQQIKATDRLTDLISVYLRWQFFAVTASP